MNRFSYHSHTADVLMKVHASTLKQLFEFAMLGMSNLLKNDFCKHINKGNCVEKISVRSVDTTVLLIDFLSEVLLKSNIQKSVYCNLLIEKLTDKEILATLSGNKIECFDEDIKAVTYHEANVFQNSCNEWEATIIFDI